MFFDFDLAVYLAAIFLASYIAGVSYRRRIFILV